MFSPTLPCVGSREQSAKRAYGKYFRRSHSIDAQQLIFSAGYLRAPRVAAVIGREQHASAPTDKSMFIIRKRYRRERIRSVARSTLPTFAAVLAQ